MSKRPEDIPAVPDPKTFPEIRDFGKRVMAEQKVHYLPVKSAGIAFFGFVALIPILIAVISIYGLIADPNEIAQQIEDGTESLSPEVSALLSSQMEDIAGNSGGAGVALLISIGLALFSGSAATKHLISTLNVIYEFPETRNPIKLRLLAYGMTLGGAVFAALAVFLTGALPAVLDGVGLGTAAAWLISIATYPVLFVIMTVVLSFLYSIAPDRPGSPRRWFTPGAAVATVLWVIVSIAFAVYINSPLASGNSYGIFSTIIVLLTYFNLTATVILLGAEVDATRVKLRDEQLGVRRSRMDPPQLVQDGTTTQYGKAALGGVLVGAALGTLVGRSTADE